MQKKFQYAELRESSREGNWYWYLNEKRVNADYVSLTLVEVLNLLGERGWQAVNVKQDNNYIYTVLVMREVD